MKKGIAVLMSLLMAGSLLAGCVPNENSAPAVTSAQPAGNEPDGSSEETEVNTSDQKPLRVGTMAAAAGIAVKRAMDQGYFAEEGVNVEITIFATGAPINEAMAAGELDIGASGAASIFSLATGNSTLLFEQMSSGGMGIWVRPDSDILDTKGEIADAPEMYGSAGSLKGKKILCAAGTSSEYNVLRYVDQFGLTSGDVNIVYMDYGAAVQAFIAGEGDAIATMAPYSTQAEDAIGAKKCCTFEDATKSPLNDLVFCSNKLVETRREDVVKFMKALWRGVEDLQDDAVRRELSMQWFADNGRSYDDATMDQEIADRRFLTGEYLTSKDYVFGASVVPYAQFNVDIGNLTEDQLDEVTGSFDSTILSEVLGVTVPSYQK